MASTPTDVGYAKRRDEADESNSGVLEARQRAKSGEPRGARQHGNTITTSRESS
jgi:hypothetical protein